MKLLGIKQLRKFEQENRRLKRLLVEGRLDNAESNRLGIGKIGGRLLGELEMNYAVEKTSG